MIKNSIFVISLLLFCAFTLKADVAPDAGYTRVSINLVTETKEDLSDYRFFLDFYGDLREVEIKSKGRSEIPSMGGGARYSSGTLIAIPKKSLNNFEGKLSNEQSKNLSQAIKSQEIEGVVELANHRFSMEIPIISKAPNVSYIIKREKNSLTAEQIKEDNQSVFSNSPLIYVLAGIFITLAILVTGIFAFRKASKKV